MPVKLVLDLNVIEVPTADLVGEQLAWAVGKAEGLDVRLAPPGYNGVPWRVFARYTGEVTIRDVRYDPHENWALAGGLIRKHKISLHAPQHGSDCWAAWKTTDDNDVVMGGATETIAACAVVVSVALGDTVQVPKEP